MESEPEKLGILMMPMCSSLARSRGGVRNEWRAVVAGQRRAAHLAKTSRIAGRAAGSVSSRRRMIGIIWRAPRRVGGECAALLELPAQQCAHTP